MKKLYTLVSIALLTVLNPAQSFAASSGTYKIPAGQFLEKDFFLRSEAVKWDEVDGIVTLKYKLPKQIDGVDPRWIQLTSVSANEPLSLRGPEGAASCSVVSDVIECAVYYRQNGDGIYSINIEAAKAYVQSRNYSPEKKVLMEKAQMSIMHEAGGVLRARIRN